MIGLKSQNFYGSEEKKMINKVFKRKIFSEFLGNYHQNFMEANMLEILRINYQNIIT